LKGKGFLTALSLPLGPDIIWQERGERPYCLSYLRWFWNSWQFKLLADSGENCFQNW